MLNYDEIEVPTPEQARANVAALFAPPSPEEQERIKARIAEEERRAQEQEANKAGTQFPQPSKEEDKAPIPGKKSWLPPEDGSVLAELPLELLLDFQEEKHRFRPYTPQKMEAMKDSITHSGIINPPLVRPHPTKKGYYELVDGRNRRTAARELGYTTMACLVRKMDDDEAILQMINSNLQQRESLLPSEKAWAYREMLEAMNRQGKRTDLTSGQVVTKLGSRSDNELGENVGESGRQVQRYVRLTYLIPDLLKRVDEGRLGLTVGVTISYMSIQGQQLICKLFFELGNTPITRKVADQLRELDAEGRLDTLTVESTVLAHTEKVKKTKWVGSMKTVRDKYFDKKDSDDDIAATIDKALEAYFKKKNVK